MRKIHLSSDRGHEDKGGVISYHSFSFDNYYNPENMNFRFLRVLNEEYIKEGKQLTEQLHKDVEIVTYVLQGLLEYKDNLGNSIVVPANGLLLLSAGTGVLHSEYCLSPDEELHFLQLWFTSGQNGLSPLVTKRLIQMPAKWGQWCLMTSQNGREGSLRIHQDVDIYCAYLEQASEIIFDCLPDRYYWMQIISGSFLFQNQILKKGDGLSLQDEFSITLTCQEEGEILLIDQG